jgi:hypothetical protein
LASGFFPNLCLCFLHERRTLATGTAIFERNVQGALPAAGAYKHQPDPANGQTTPLFMNKKLFFFI